MKLNKNKHFSRIIRVLFVIFILTVGSLYVAEQHNKELGILPDSIKNLSPAIKTLDELEVKGRAPKTGYSRTMFSSGWGDLENCDLRNYILKRDLSEIVFVDKTCKIKSGTLKDPYTGKTILFSRGKDTSALIQIDHVVALSDAWQKGAQNLSAEKKYSIANDPANLLAVDGPSNQAKGDSDAASWLPPNKDFRCNYVTRQIFVKKKYSLWVTPAEKNAMADVLKNCPHQALPTSLKTAPSYPSITKVLSSFTEYSFE